MESKRRRQFEGKAKAWIREVGLSKVTQVAGDPWPSKPCATSMQLVWLMTASLTLTQLSNLGFGWKPGLGNRGREEFVCNHRSHPTPLPTTKWKNPPPLSRLSSSGECFQRGFDSSSNFFTTKGHHYQPVRRPLSRPIAYNFPRCCLPYLTRIFLYYLISSSSRDLGAVASLIEFLQCNVLEW